MGGERELVEKQGGLRTKLRTRGGEEVDTMFVDRRNDPSHPLGGKLVIACEVTRLGIVTNSGTTQLRFTLPSGI